MLLSFRLGTWKVVFFLPLIVVAFTCFVLLMFCALFHLISLFFKQDPVKWPEGIDERFKVCVQPIKAFYI